MFSELDLVVQPGDRVALVGRNGSGKSTLMTVMAGLVEADQGEIIVPIDAKLLARDVAAFAITVETPGGVVESKGPLQMLAVVEKS